MTTSTENQDVVDILRTDHAEALDLIAQIKTAANDERRELADALTAELVRHAIAEEMYLYPPMREHLAKGDEMVEHDVKEHQELEEIMKAWEGVDGSEPRFLELLTQLEEVLRDHIEDEQGEQFAQLRAQFSHDQLVEMGEKVEMAKKIAPTRPHPSAPHSELFHKVVGP